VKSACGTDDVDALAKPGLKPGNLIRWAGPRGCPIATPPNQKTGAGPCLILDLKLYEKGRGHWFSFRVLVGDKIVFLEEAYARRNYEVIS